MKIRTIDQLSDRIAEDRLWRVREISALRLECQKYNSASETGKALRRSFVPLAYAHWEGYVKKTAHYYLEYVALQGLRLKDLSACFVSMYLWREFAHDIRRSKHFSLKDASKAISARQDTVVRLVYKDIISTQSNLNSEVLKEICASIGVPYLPFETKEFFIDAILLQKRNTIAHGEWQDIDSKTMNEVSAEVITLIDTFRNLLENSAATRLYLANP